MLIFGAGGHAKVIISCLEASGEKIEAIFDDDLSKTEISGYFLAGQYNPDILQDQAIIIAIGNNLIRSQIARKVYHQLGKVFHPSCIIDRTAKIGDGTVVLQGSIIQADSVIGNHVIVNTKASIDHDCKISDYVHIAPGVTICGNVHVGEFTLIGAGTTVIPNINIGSYCTIAAGSVITTDIPNYSIVRGNPAKIIKTQGGKY